MQSRIYHSMHRVVRSLRHETPSDVVRVLFRKKHYMANFEIYSKDCPHRSQDDCECPLTVVGRAMALGFRADLGPGSRASQVLKLTYLLHQYFEIDVDGTLCRRERDCTQQTPWDECLKLSSARPLAVDKHNVREIAQQMQSAENQPHPPLLPVYHVDSLASICESIVGKVARPLPWQPGDMRAVPEKYQFSDTVEEKRVVRKLKREHKRLAGNVTLMFQSSVQTLEGALSQKLASPLSETRVIVPLAQGTSPPLYDMGEERANVMMVRSDKDGMYSDTARVTWQQFWSRQDVQPYRSLGNTLLCRQKYEFGVELCELEAVAIGSSMATEDYQRFDHMLQFTPLVGLFSHYRVIDVQLSVVFRVLAVVPVCIYMQPKISVVVPSLPMGRLRSVSPSASFDPVTEVMGLALTTDEVVGVSWDGTFDDWSGTGIDGPKNHWEIEVGIRGAAKLQAALRVLVGVTYCLY